MRLLCGGYVRTTNLQIEYAWPSGVDSHNTLLDRRVATWIARNEKHLNKKLPHESAQILMEEFPELTYVEMKDFANRMAKAGR